MSTRLLVTYKLTERGGTPIKCTFYEQDVQKVLLADDALFRVDKVLKRKCQKVFVSWKGWPSSYNSWIWKKRFTAVINVFRITLISDPTQEFPNNSNNSFKVRLPSLIKLSGTELRASLWSISVPDEGQSSGTIAKDPHTQLVKFSHTLTKRNQNGVTWHINWENVIYISS